jgi:hypothetical protein
LKGSEAASEPVQEQVASGALAAYVEQPEALAALITKFERGLARKP